MTQARSILEDSSSEDKRRRKPQQTDSSSESQKKPKRKYRIKMMRVTGCSKEEERRDLREKEEDEEGKLINDDNDNHEDKNPVDSQQENPPSPPTPRRSPPTPRRSRSPPPTPRRRRLQRLLSSDQQDFQQEFRNRIVDNIDAMVNEEDDEVTLNLGSEDEGFKSCSEDKENPHEKELKKVWMRIKAHEYIEAMKKAKRYNLPETEVEVKRLYDVLRDEHSLTKELYRTLKEIHGHLLEAYCDQDESDHKKGKQSKFQAIQEAIAEVSKIEGTEERSTSSSSTKPSQGDEVLLEKRYEEKIAEGMKDQDVSTYDGLDDKGKCSDIEIQLTR